MRPRKRVNSKGDGVNLIGQVFGLDNARLVFTELGTESGRDDQKGFLQILMGAYVGIRNPKAHSLEHDLDKLKAAQYLVLASLLARRVADAKLIKARKAAAAPKAAAAQKARRKAR